MPRTKSNSTEKKSTSRAAKTMKEQAPKTSARAKKAQEPPAEPPQPIRREVTAVVFILMALFTVISYFNTDGKFIRQFSELMKGLIGYGFWLLAPTLLLVGIIFFNHKGRPVTARVTCAFLIPLIAAAIVHLFMYIYPAESLDIKQLANMFFEEGQKLESGGALGGLLSYALEDSLSVWGALPVLLITLIILLLVSLNTSLGALLGIFKNRPQYNPAAYDKKEDVLVQTPVVDIPLGEKPVKRGRNKQQTVITQPAAPQNLPKQEYNFDIPLGDDIEELTLIDSTNSKPAKPEKRGPAVIRNKPVRPGVEKLLPDDEDAIFAGIVETIKNMPPEEPKKPEEEKKPTAEPVKPKAEPAKTKAMATEISDPPKKTDKTKIKRISRDDIDDEAEAVAAAVDAAEGGQDYVYPPVELLRNSNSTNIDARDEIRVNKERLESALHSFGINARIVSVIHGPTVTRYDIELEQGVKLARITNLSGDIALSLGVVNVRIAPIPDKISTVGIEVPNKIISTVYLRDIIDSPRFSTAKSKISFAIGKDISGDGVVGNIAKLPHLLIAGTTGSGKSVCMNSLILSLLYKARPDEVRLIMIDPKMVELGIYNGIPHLYVPVVTDPKKAAGALQWSVVEMLKRYRQFADVGVRDLEHYNMHCREEGLDTLPQVVIVIDELADLMLVASKEVEESICRVAQMGRAAGMHLVIATQRPSADVITGLMKANIPSRIAFAVSSAMESRIILDQGGAEKLIGMGDMLFSPVGSGKPTRIQGAFVSDEEREDVITFIKENSVSSQTNDELVAYMDASKESKDSKDSPKESGNSLASEYDEMLPQAVEVVIEMKSCSVSMLQRRVKLGYSRAARIVDQMEELGVVGPFEGAKSRQVLVDMAGWRAIQVRLGMIEDDGIAYDDSSYDGDELDSEY